MPHADAPPSGVECGNCATRITQPFIDCAPGPTPMHHSWLCAGCFLRKKSLWLCAGKRRWSDARPGPVWPLSLPSSPFVSTLTTGLEFEMFHGKHATDRVDDLCRAWELAACGLTEDGSIDSPAGIEIQTPPTSGKLLELWIHAVCNTARSYGFVVDKSCGLHVHVEVTTTTPTARANQLRRLLLIAKAAEPMLFAMLPGSRWNSGYCAALRLNGPDLARIERTSNAAYSVWGSRKNGGSVRYKGINLDSIGRHGTVEFRYHSGTLNAEKVIAWVRLCHAMMECALAVKDAAIPTRFASHEERRHNMLSFLGLTDLEPYVRERTRLFGHDVQQLEAWAKSLDEAPPLADYDTGATLPMPAFPTGDRLQGEADEPEQEHDAPNTEYCGRCDVPVRDCTCCGACGETADDCTACPRCGEHDNGYCDTCERYTCCCTCTTEDNT